MIIQDDHFGATDSITIRALTTDVTDAPLMRLVVTPSNSNGLRAVSRPMIDKVTTVPKSKLERKLGSLGAVDSVRLDRAIVVFLGLTFAHQAETET